LFTRNSTDGHHWKIKSGLEGLRAHVSKQSLAQQGSFSQLGHTNSILCSDIPTLIFLLKK